MNTKTKKSASFYVAYLVKKLWALVALSLVVVAVTLSVVRYSLPYMNDQKHHLEQWLSEQVGAEIKIAEITAKWQGIGPAIVLRDLQLVQNDQSPISLTIAETAIEVDFWQSVRARQIQSNKFDLREMELTLDIASLEQQDSQYPIVDALETLFLQQLQLFSISESKIIINSRNEQQQIVLIDQVSWINKEQHHQGVGQLQIEEIAKNSAFFILDLYGNQDSLYGTFFARAEDVDISPWVQKLVSSKQALLESRSSFVMWAAIEENSLQSVQLDFSKSRFEWLADESSPQEKNLKAAILGGQINATPDNKDWLVNLNDFTMQINDKVLITNWNGKFDQVGALTIEHKQPIELVATLPFLGLLLEPTQIKQLQELQPQATLNSLHFFRNTNGDLGITAAINDIQWQQTQHLPGMAGLSSELNWFNGNGRLNIKGKSGRLAIDRLLPEDIDYQRFYGNFYLQVDSKSVNVFAEDMLFQSEKISLQPHIHYSSKDNFLSFSSTVKLDEFDQLPQLYPAGLMGEKTADYLTEALQQGQIQNAKLLWHGSVEAFPFDQNQGVFQAQLQIKEGTLKFAEQWPKIEHLDVDVLFENRGLSMNSQKGNLLDVELIDLTADIPNLAENAILTIAIDAQGTGSQVTDLMQQSSLAGSLGKTLEHIKISGPLTTNLNLHIPLNGDEIVAKGDAVLHKNVVNLLDLNVVLEQAEGKVSFVNSIVTAKDVKANLLRQPIRLALDGEQLKAGYQTDIHLAGDWQVTPILETHSKGLTNYLSGNSKWSADIAVTLPDQGYQYTATIFSELTNLKSELPAPFDKSSQQELPLVVTSIGNQQASTVKVTLGDEVAFNGNLPHQKMQFSRAHLAIGESDLMGMGLGFSISANLSELNASPWYEFIDTLINDLPDNNQQPLLEAPKRIFVNADNALIASQKLTGLEMVVKNTSDSWLLDINAKQTRMKVALNKDWLQQGVDVKADFLDITKWESIESSLDESDQFSPNVDNLPPIRFSCARCSFLESDLGQVDVKLSRSSTGMKIEQLRFDNDHGLFNGSGDWVLENGQSSTQINGEFSSSDFGAFTKGFNFDSGIKDSKASSNIDLSWEGAPYEFNFESLNGNIDWGLTDGYLTEVSDQGSRIFSLLSLDSLVRKLQLDFRDVFAKGFFYDKINGSFQLQDGIAYTQDTLVDGGAGEITMEGYTDLNAQQLNYQIEFAPKVTSSLPVIIAWMVNPATAIAALALDQMLTSAKVISNIKFSLTGSLDEPQLTELGRDSKEVVLPARVIPPSEESSPAIDQQLDAPVNIDVPAEIPVSG